MKKSPFTNKNHLVQMKKSHFTNKNHLVQIEFTVYK